MKQSTFMFPNGQITVSPRSKFSNCLTTGVSVVNNGEMIEIHPVSLEGVSGMFVRIPAQDTNLLVDAIDDVTGCVTDLLTAAQEIGYFLGTYEYRSDNRFKDIEDTIRWAKEFCRVNDGKDWENSGLDWESELANFVRAKVKAERPGYDHFFND